ncbi:DedA family protein [Candidatus Parvarchaeota archaeon]|uniref:DedA family protein n=1 Tax=Candidatus Acidifodinimicrobium mancum TaxID=2898728 RepID=A0A8T3V0T4_9ARCH|nr:DedA family protein [Candidatus Acidifodinimicrobium mancum]MBE5728787.1 DedA family protein [Candidatus Acidifodinimicrobium mancum]
MFFGIDVLVSFIQQYRYIAFFILAFLETTLAPIPSEVVLPFAGAMIALNLLKPVFLVTDVWLGNLLGNIFGYLVAYFVSIDVVLKYGRKLGFKMEGYMQGEKWIKKYGVPFAFITELLPVVRSVTSIVCGAFKMDFKKFVILTFAGFVIWSSALMYIGYVLAGNWQSVVSFLENFSLYIGIAATLVLLFIMRHWLIKLGKKILEKL